MKGLSEKIVASGFILAMLLLGGVGIESYLSVKELIESQRSVNHTHHVLDTLNQISDSLETADRGRRSYFVSKGEEELTIWRTGVQMTQRSIAEVRQLTSDNPEQQQRLNEIEPLITARLVLFQRFIALVRQNKLDPAAQRKILKQNLFLQQQIQLKLQAMEQTEEVLFEQRSDAIDQIVQRAVVVASIGYGLSFCLLASIFFLLQKEIRSRKAAEIALQKHAEDVYDLYNHAPCGYHSLDATGVFIRVNDTELAWLGYTRDEIIHKKTFSDLTTAQSAIAFQENFARFKEQGWISDVEFELVCKDGTILPVSLSATAINDADGNFVMSRSTLFDITDRKQAQIALQQANEQLEARVQARTAELSQVNALLRSELIDRKQAQAALSESEKQLRLITNALPVLISYVDAEERYRFNNQAYEQWFGYSWTTLQGQSLKDVLGEAAYQTIKPHVETALSGQEVAYESAVPYKDGGKRWVSAVYIPDFGEKGTVKGYFALISDITDRKRAEDALRDSEQRLSLAIEGSGMATWDVDLATGKALWSLQHFKLLGYEPVPSGEATLGMWYRCAHPDDREWVSQAAERAIQERSFYRSEHRIMRADNGQIVWLAAFGRALYNEAGEAVRFIGLILNITDRKQAELALQQAKDGLEIQVQDRTAALKQVNDDLQRSNQELEQFAYVASHDLQEPLRAIMGYTQLLTQDYRDRLDDTAQSYAAYIVDGATRMQRLIQDLLHYSRVGTRELVFEPTDCNAVLEQVLSNLQVAIAESNAAITYDPLPIVHADKSQLVQLLQNLIGNAIKFCREGSPQVHISVRREERGETREGRGERGDERGERGERIPHPTPHPLHPTWLFSVQDQGIGIKPRYLERIFEIFKRLHTRTEFPGTGIGLAICQKIVDRHGGQIWATSNYGHGTTFYFTIPSADDSNL
ncbi:MAG: PAS domain S-box protein [Lyngbya sp. HA4199-MV5]|nr:PAS domain S-box protein [Lyngbya sp. HA4199-MV5]